MTDEWFGELTDEELDRVVGGSKDMKVLCETWRRYLNEQEDFDAFLEQTFNKVAQLFGPQLEDEAEEIEQEIDSKGQIDEGVMLALGLTLAVPAIVKIFTGVAKVFGHAVEGWTGKDLGVDEVADKIISYANKAHHLFQKPIGFFVTKVLRIKDKAKAHQATEILYTLLIAFLMVFSGAGAAEAVTKGQTGLAGFEGALAAVKGGEVGAFLKKVVSSSTLDEVYSEKQRKWACAQIDNPTSLTKAQAKEMCSASIKKDT